MARTPKHIGGGKSGITIDKNDLARTIPALVPYIDNVVGRTMDFYAPQVEASAKQKAPWTDRTANARNGLAAEHIKEGELIHSIVLYHQVPYGIWLEVKWDGRFATILPRIQEYGPKVMETVSGILDRFPRGTA